MNTDFRVLCSFPDHHKTKRLIRKVGHEGAFGLIRIWAYAAQYRPSGVLTDLDDSDIEGIAGWVGDEGALVAALQECKFLGPERTESDGGGYGGFVIHDWQVHNPFAASAPQRSAQATKAAQARWAERGVPFSNAASINQQSEQDADAMRPARMSIAPYPYPSPDPDPDPDPSKQPSSPPVTAKGYPENFERFWSAYVHPGNKGSKHKAHVAWKKAVKITSNADLVSAIQMQLTSKHFKGSNGADFVPQPVTWLNQRRWEDEVKVEERPPERVNLALACLEEMEAKRPTTQWAYVNGVLTELPLPKRLP